MYFLLVFFENFKRTQIFTFALPMSSSSLRSTKLFMIPTTLSSTSKGGFISFDRSLSAKYLRMTFEKVMKSKKKFGTSYVKRTKITFSHYFMIKYQADMYVLKLKILVTYERKHVLTFGHMTTLVVGKISSNLAVDPMVALAFTSFSKSHLD